MWLPAFPRLHGLCAPAGANSLLGSALALNVQVHFVDDARTRSKDSAQAACRERGGAIFGTYDRLPELHNGRHLYLLRGSNHKVSVLWWSEASSAWVITVNVAPAILCKLPDTSPRLGASFCAYDPSPLPEGITSPWSVAAVGETAKLLKWEEVPTVHCRPGPTPEDVQKDALVKENAQKAVEARKVAEKESARKAMALEAEETADEELKRAMAGGGIGGLRAAIETHQKDVRAAVRVECRSGLARACWVPLCSAKALSSCFSSHVFRCSHLSFAFGRLSWAPRLVCRRRARRCWPRPARCAID